jgi:hypothetical protein
MEILECFLLTIIAPRFQAGEFGPQLIEKQGFDDFENVLFGCVMGTLFATLLLLHHRLKKRPKNGG